MNFGSESLIREDRPVNPNGRLGTARRRAHVGEGPRESPLAPHHHEHHIRTPTDELTHEQKLARQRTHITILSVVLVLVLLMLAYASIFDLNSWAEWVVLGAICVTAVGALVAVSTRQD
jgi:hypothetical protein